MHIMLAYVILYFNVAAFYIYVTSGFNPFDCARNGYSWHQSYANSSSLVHATPSSESCRSIKTEETIKTRIVNGYVDFDDEIWKDTPDAKALVSQLLQYEAPDRATVYSALESPWISGELEELERGYERRITARSGV